MKRTFCTACALLSFVATACAEIDVQTLIDQAVAQGRKQVVIPPGVHRIAPSGRSDSYHLLVKNAKDIEIVGDGATLVFSDSSKGGIRFDACTSVTLRGLTLDWDPLPFTQGRITAIDPDGKWYEVQVEPGYSDDPAQFVTGAETYKCGAFLYDPKTRLLKDGAWDMFGAQMTRVRPGVLHVSFKSARTIQNNIAQVGDLLVVSIRAQIGIRFIDCRDMTVDHVTFWTAPGIALQEAGGDGGNHYSHVTVTRGPAPADGSPRLLSSTADAFHSSGIRKGPLVEHCTLEYQGDDGVAIHGAYGLVVGSTSPTTIRFSPRREMTYRPGDQVYLYDPQTYRLRAEARIVSVTRVDPPGDGDAKKIADLWKLYHQQAAWQKYYELQLDQPVGGELGELICSPQSMGDGFIVRDNVIGRHRAHAIRIKASDGVIENNRIEDVGGAAVALGPEFSYWLEGDYVRHVIVRNNTIRRVGLSGNVVRNNRALTIGAISIYASVPAGGLPPPDVQGNNDITISDNVIDESGGIGILVSCANNVLVNGNRIGAIGILGLMEGGKKWGFDPKAPIFVTRSKDVRLEDNRTQ